MKNRLFGKIEDRGLRVENFSTRDILEWPLARQEDLRRELTDFYPRIFLSEKDWAYVVRHYFFDPAPLVRQGLFIRGLDGSLLATASFDIGPAHFRGIERTTAYVHIRALLPGIQGNGLGKTIARWMLSHDPDYLFTTCMQPSSLYSWIRLVESELGDHYELWPALREGRALTVLPTECMGEALDLFAQVYSGHVKGDSERVEKVVRDLTVRFVRRGVGMTFRSNPWVSAPDDVLVQALDLRESDGVLLVIRKKTP